MIGILLRRALLGFLAAAGLIGLPAAAGACPFCSMQGQTLTGEVNQASMVLFGTLTNAQLGKGGEFADGSTDLVIEAVIKSDPILGDNPKKITLPRYVPTDPKTKVKFLIFCDVFKGKIDPYRGITVQADSDMPRYLKGALDTKGKDIGTRLRYAFNYLDNADIEVANDAYKEFANADYKDYRPIAKTLSADKLADWLEDAKTPTFRYGLYASLLGHCGGDKHAALLRKMLDDPQKRLNSGVDGMLAGYTMLKPKDGWKYTRGILDDPSKEFMLRYAALRAARFLWDQRPDLVDKKELVEGVARLLDQSDIADLAIEDLRRWGRWEVIDHVLGLYGKKSHDVPIIRRSILRYALSCPPEHKAAAAFVQNLRRKDPEMVKDAEELLKLETTNK
jgi:hypothetical protein